jgi:nitroimidazol reductase NimA-like FMN-containing flavoprotein (pyridoxamine 5'-phosphate oxidase superfamily)
MQGTLSDTEIEDLLSSETFGHLGCTDGPKPYVIPMAFAYKENTIYGQTTAGKKVEILRKNPQVCFQVQDLQAHRWRSVLCHGLFEELDFEALQRREDVEAVRILTERIGRIQEKVGIAVPFSFSDGASPLTVNEKKSSLFRIVIQEKAGRFFMG